MANLIATVAMTLGVCQGHSLISSNVKCRNWDGLGG